MNDERQTAGNKDPSEKVPVEHLIRSAMEGR
jgi:hypothetical protein